LTAHFAGDPGLSAPGLVSWYWDVERDLLWTAPAMHSLQDGHPWVGERDPASAVPMCDWLERLTEGRQHELADFVDALRRSDRGRELRTEVRLHESRWFALRASVEESQGGKATSAFGLAYDLTRYRLSEQELRFHERFLEGVGNAEPLGDILESLCRELEDRLPGTRVAALVHDRDTARLWHAAAPSLSPAYVAAIDGIPVAPDGLVSGAAAHHGTDVIISDVRTGLDEALHLLEAEGTRSVWAHPLISPVGAALGSVTVHHSTPGAPSADEIALVTRYGRLAAIAVERALLSPQLLRAASVDHHTGLPNRASFLELVNVWRGDCPDEMAVLVVAIEGYHQVAADRHHLDIDAILLQVAQRISGVVGVGRESIVAGLNADRFGVAVTLPSRGDAMALARRILRTFDVPVSVEGAGFYLAATVGIAFSSNADAATMLSEAGIAVIAARSDGPGGIRVYDDALRESMRTRLEREADLRRGIEAEEFRLVYQPSYNIECDRFDRAESLVRWHHPVRGIVPPDDFIPLAEQTGLIVPLGGLILRQAVRQAKRWHALFPDMHLSVNVSAAQLANPTFADEVAATIDDAGVPTAIVAIEVTESGLMENLDVARATLDRFVELGLHVLIDDFGTGHSSLARLDEIPVHALKIDKRFIQRLVTDPVAPTVVRAIVDVARAHGLRVTAEGVEDAETLAMVTELGCHYVQGYHFCRPMPAAEAEEFLLSYATKRN